MALAYHAGGYFTEKPHAFAADWGPDANVMQKTAHNCLRSAIGSEMGPSRSQFTLTSGRPLLLYNFLKLFEIRPQLNFSSE
ncbi:hypothetical protein [Paenibacillus senegalensis]|uniref:hypothetical protein n=1 Tax=Paenibacillus senegalensis TaxID=1465766 RepID=UPI000287D1F3|nr:hypothetical protein [Paenibacillus senegalensis]